MAQYTTEADTPDVFDVTYDEDNNPQRDLTDFVVTRGDEKISVCTLDEENDVEIVARGRIVNKGRTLKVVTAPLVEWCIEYGTAPNLWIRTSEVWYKLQKPAREYAKIHELARRRYELCSRIFILCTSYDRAGSTWEAFVSLLAMPYGDMQGYSEKDILLERDFILAQIRNLNDDLQDIMFVKELKAKKSGGRKSQGGSSGKKNGTGSSATNPNAAPGDWHPAGLDASAEARLLKKAEKALGTISGHKNAYPFLEPVNPTLHGCPDYLERIAKPMDYGTMKNKIVNGDYKLAFEIAKDVRLVASNCREYNGRAHNFSVWATDLEKKFMKIMRDAEKAERASMEKRLNGASVKKRRVSDAAAGSKGPGNAKNASKVSRKLSGSADPPPVPPEEPVVEAEQVGNGEGGPCARDAPDKCSKPSRADSKYCSDECGMILARLRVDEMMKTGFDVGSFIQNSATKSLIQSRNV